MTLWHSEEMEKRSRDELVRDLTRLMHDIAAYQAAHGIALSDDEAMELATVEVRAIRAERAARRSQP